jgi:hypothetical protein
MPASRRPPSVSIDAPNTGAHPSGGTTMTDERIHRAVSADGTEIAGRVQGQGPALVLFHGGIGDGDIAWRRCCPT